MSNQDERHFFDRLVHLAWLSTAGNQNPAEQDSDIQCYLDMNLCPGKNYLLAGHSYFSQFRIIGTSLEARRAGFIALIFHEKGDRFQCVTVRDILSSEGFTEVIDEDECEWLESLPEDTLIGPAYDRHGRRIPTAFAIWRTIEEDAPIYLEIARH